jgi:transposase InsO family protein
LRFSFIDNEKKAYHIECAVQSHAGEPKRILPLEEMRPVIHGAGAGATDSQIRGLHQESKATCGGRRMAQELKALGLRCGQHKAGTLMQLAGVAAKQRKRFKAITDSNHQLPVAPNLLHRRCRIVREFTQIATFNE